MKFVVWKYDYIIQIIQIIIRTLGAIFKTLVWLQYLNTPNFSCRVSMPLKDDVCNYAKTLKQMFLVNSKHLWEKVSRVWILTADLSAPHLKPANTNFLHYIFATRMVSFFQIKSDSSLLTSLNIFFFNFPCLLIPWFPNTNLMQNL